MEYNERDRLDSAITPNCHPITWPLDPICYAENYAATCTLFVMRLFRKCKSEI